MSNAMDISHTHFRQMRKHLANVEKEWAIGAMAGVKKELQELGKMSREIELVIKNQLYYNLRAPEKESSSDQKNNSDGRGTTTGQE